MSVGVMEDYKLRDLRASHTLGWYNLQVSLFINLHVSFFFHEKKKKAEKPSEVV